MESGEPEKGETKIILQRLLTSSAWIISRLSEPPSIIIIYLIYTFSKTGITIQSKLLLIPITLVLNIIVPLIYFLFLFKEGKISDIDQSDRKQRFSQMTLMIICWSITLCFISLFADEFLWQRYLAMYIVGLFLVGITFFWKISFHAAIITLLSVSIAADNPAYRWIVVALPPVVWSRWYLKKHTILQLTSAVLLSATVYLLIVQR